MNSYYVRQDGQAAYGPYEAAVIKAWLADGQLKPDTECSLDGAAWSRLGDVRELGGNPGAAATASGGFPELSLLIRQGANIQGPFRMSRLRGYVAQRRIQPYMLFSQDGIFWLGPEHVPGLIPADYVPVAPAARPTVVPSSPGPDAAAAAASPSAATRAPQPAPTPGADVGSITLTGYRLDDADLAPPSMPASRAPTVPVPRAAPFSAVRAAPSAPAPAPATTLTYFVRQDGGTAYGPYAADVLRTWIAEGQIGPETEFSRDGRSWAPGASLAGFFAPTFPGRGAASRTSAPSPIEEVPEERASWRKTRRPR